MKQAIIAGVALSVALRLPEPVRADDSGLASEDVDSADPSDETMPWYIPSASEAFVEKHSGPPGPGLIASSSLALSTLTTAHTFEAGDTLTGATSILGYLGWRTFGFEGGVNLVKNWPVVGIAVNRYSGHMWWADPERHLRLYALLPSLFVHASGNLTNRGAHEVGVDVTGVRLQYDCRFFVEVRAPTIEAWLLVDGTGADATGGVGLAISAGMY